MVVTPTRIRNGRKITAAREPIIALMAPFSGKSIVAFEDVPVTKTARRYVHVQNPTDKPLQVNTKQNSICIIQKLVLDKKNIYLPISFSHR